MKAIDNINNIKGSVINVSSGEQHSIADVVNAVEKKLGRKIDVEYGNFAVKQHEPKMWVADISKAKKLLGWSPINSLTDGLSKFMAWAKNNPIR